MNKPQFYANINDRFDCDPADCSDRNEISIESAKEFTETPEEFGSEHAAGFGTPEYVGMPMPEQDFFNAPGLIAPLGMTATEATQAERKTDLSSLYESAEDCGCGCGKDRDDCGCDGRTDSCGYNDDTETAQEYCDPSDETAAVDGYETSVDEPTAEYDTEAADDCGCGCGRGNDRRDGHDGCDGDSCEFSDNSAETAREYGVDLADSEMAACDDRTFAAQEKCSLDDYEIISDVLGGEKQLVKLYSTALCESAEEPLRALIKENLAECANDQFATFEYMEKRGLYPTDEASEEQIVEAKRLFGPLCK